MIFGVLLVGDALGDVPAYTEDQFLSPVYRAIGADLNVVDGAVFSTVARFEVIACIVDDLEHFHQLFFIKLSVPVPDMKSVDFIQRVTEHMGKFLIGLIYLAVLFQNNDPVSRLVNQNTPPGHFILKQLFRLLALGDIFYVSKGSHYLAVNVFKPKNRNFKPFGWVLVRWIRYHLDVRFPCFQRR
nr:hypothetical protein [uncultured Desulfosarcina sp.]